jgi:hypothetical protein
VRGAAYFLKFSKNVKRECMETTTQTKQELSTDVRNADEQQLATYAGASMLKVTTEEQAELMAPFPDEAFEIKPQGFVYLPHMLIRQKLNRVLGIGNWSLIPKNISEEINGDKVKVFFTGALYIRGCFVSIDTGEGTYFKNNFEQSYASATSAAKSDCMVRTAKDIGVAWQMWDPSFMRTWQKKHGVRVWVTDDGTANGKNKKVLWRRKDLDPFWNETGVVPNKPTVDQREQKTEQNPKRPITEAWAKSIAAVESKTELLELYNANKSTIDEWPELKLAFKNREAQLPKNKTTV